MDLGAEWLLWSWKTLSRSLKGSFTIFLFSVRTHILDSNEVWYSWFWSEGSINALNPKFLGFYFVPTVVATCDLISRRQRPHLAAPRLPLWTIPLRLECLCSHGKMIKMFMLTWQDNSLSRYVEASWVPDWDLTDSSKMVPLQMTLMSLVMVQREAYIYGAWWSL